VVGTIAGGGNDPIRRPGTRFNPDGTPTDPFDQLEEIIKAKKRKKLIESIEKSRQKARQFLEDLRRGLERLD
jgi:hypothetical protein